ncbi:MAG: tyrosine--tRNA ligase [Bacteroidia bacterium]|nr:tyrosine--tRNA ligase [Bacteroidia bacterium]MCZ2247618.1 tyrosine--tRNA ligase [Bacteroidia bacterium]
MINNNFVEELRWRGMLHDIMPETEEQLKKEMTAGYIGFDPTAESLHVGNLAQIMTLLHFQQAGHKPYVLIGGATGMVGDPSGKSQERNLLNEETLKRNIEGIKAQLLNFLDFRNGANKAEMVNNYDWFKNFSFLDFIRDAGKHITVNYMMAKDSVKKRINGEDREGMSFTEFSYQLIQGYDFFHLWKNNNVLLQMGGSDQWGNITTGTEFIRRKAGGKAYALTTMLIKKSDGSKFGKSEGGNIWLDKNKTSPYNFYQFWLNTSDEDAKSYIRIFTLMSKDEIEKIEQEHAQAPHLRKLQHVLAKDITIRVHSLQDYTAAYEASEILFGKGTSEVLSKINEATFLDVFEGVPNFKISKDLLINGVSLIDLMAVHSSIAESKGEARKGITAGAVSVNKNKVTDINSVITVEDLINNKYILIQKGKKNNYLIIAE